MTQDTVSGENMEIPETPVIDRRYSNMGWKNKLYFGDNLKILRDYVATESVDLIYLDPPQPLFARVHERNCPGDGHPARGAQQLGALINSGVGCRCETLFSRPFKQTSR